MSAPPAIPTPADAAHADELMAQVADALAWPLLLLRADATLLHANLAARMLLQRGKPLRVDMQQRLSALPGAGAAAGAANDATELDLAVKAVAGGAPHRLLRLGGTRGGFTAALSALPTRAAGDDALVLMALTPAEGMEADVMAFAELHGLTTAETRVLQRLSLGESSARAAKALGVAATTVRSHTMALRRKTGHASLGALMRALTAMPPLARLQGRR